jgi:putative ABC transport system permease protein
VLFRSVASRTREIATLKAIGFKGSHVVISFMIESILIALLGGFAGTLIILPINGFTASTINWQTFSHMSFAFSVTPGIIVAGILFSLILGLIGGIFPAIQAARIPIATALREL